jgi:hypothetical protein
MISRANAEPTLYGRGDNFGQTVSLFGEGAWQPGARCRTWAGRVVGRLLQQALGVTPGDRLLEADVVGDKEQASS